MFGGRNPRDLETSVVGILGATNFAAPKACFETKQTSIIVHHNLVVPILPAYPPLATLESTSTRGGYRFGHRIILHVEGTRQGKARRIL